MILSAIYWRTGHSLLSDLDDAKSTLSDALLSFVRPDNGVGAFGDRRGSERGFAVGGRSTTTFGIVLAVSSVK
jgi:hypothetical protein